MFTGLVQSLATVRSAKPDGSGGLTLVVADPVSGSATLGESIAINGCCLTVVASDAGQITFQLGPETLAKTTFGLVKAGDRVNLERALRVGDAIGGHFVTGHVDAVGTIHSIETSGQWSTFVFEVPESDDDLLIDKGSIAIDGISLTVVTASPGRVTVMVIPHTKSATTLGVKCIGDRVHLEFDMLAKHVRKLFAKMEVSI
jgi:riboflavin synthase